VRLCWGAFVRVVGLVAAGLLAGCGGGGTSASDASVPDEAPLSVQATLGEQIFNDVSLSASGRQSCASCHDGDHAHAPANALAVQPGGPLLDQQGRRQTPSIDYLAFNTSFHFDADDTPTGGFFWDGRASSLQDQAGQPFVNPFEMANADVADVVARLSRASYAAQFQSVFGADIFSRESDGGSVASQYARLGLANFLPAAVTPTKLMPSSANVLPPSGTSGEVAVTDSITVVPKNNPLTSENGNPWTPTTECAITDEVTSIVLDRVELSGAVHVSNANPAGSPKPPTVSRHRSL